MPERWFFSFNGSEEIQCFQVSSHPTCMVFSRRLVIRSDMSWQVYVGSHLVSLSNTIFNAYSKTISPIFLKDLMQHISGASLCYGNFEPEFTEVARLRKNKFLSPSGEVVAILDESMCVNVDGVEYSATVRHVHCSILLMEQSMCSTCTEYRNTLRSIVSRHRKLKIVSSRINTRYLHTPQRCAYIRSLQRAIKSKNVQIKRLNAKVKKLMESSSCVELDDGLNSDILSVIEDHKALEKDDFKRIFWQQQVCICFHLCILILCCSIKVKANKAKKNGIRWHPLFIRLCLNIMLTSGKTYDILRESGFICLPSKRTLRDYTHWHKIRPGFDATIINHLREEAKIDTLADWQRYGDCTVD